MMATSQLPMPLVVGSFTRDAIFGAALLFAALRKSQFAGAAAIIVATFLTLGVVAPIAFDSVAFESVHQTRWMAIDLAIATIVIAPSLFPWSGSANKPVLFWIGLTIGATALLLLTAAVLARL